MSLITSLDETFRQKLRKRLIAKIDAALAELKDTLNEYTAKQRSTEFYLARTLAAHKKRIGDYDIDVTKMWSERVKQVLVLSEVAHHMVKASRFAY